MTDIVKIKKSDGSFKEIVLDGRHSIHLLEGDVIYIEEDLNKVQVNITQNNQLEINYTNGNSVIFEGLSDLFESAKNSPELLNAILNFKDEILDLESLDTYDKLIDALEDYEEESIFELNTVMQHPSSELLIGSKDSAVFEIEDTSFEYSKHTQSTYDTYMQDDWLDQWDDYDDYYEHWDESYTQWEESYSHTQEVIEETQAIHAEMDFILQRMMGKELSKEELSSLMERFSHLKGLYKDFNGMGMETFAHSQKSFFEAKSFLDVTQRRLEEAHLRFEKDKVHNPHIQKDENFIKLEEAYERAKVMFEQSKLQMEQSKEQMDILQNNLRTMSEFEDEFKLKIESIIEEAQAEMDAIENKFDEKIHPLEREKLLMEKSEIIIESKKQLSELIFNNAKEMFDTLDVNNEEEIKILTSKLEQSIEATKLYMDNLTANMSRIEAQLGLLEAEKARNVADAQRIESEITQLHKNDPKYNELEYIQTRIEEERLFYLEQEKALLQEQEKLSENLESAQKDLDEAFKIEKEVDSLDNGYSQYIEEETFYTEDTNEHIEVQVQTELSNDVILDFDAMTDTSTPKEIMPDSTVQDIGLDTNEYSLESEILSKVDALENTDESKEKPTEPQKNPAYDEACIPAIIKNDYEQSETVIDL